MALADLTSAGASLEGSTRAAVICARAIRHPDEIFATFQKYSQVWENAHRARRSNVFHALVRRTRTYKEE